MKSPKPARLTGWAVYQVAAQGGEPGGKAVCRQREWPALEAAGTGRCTLIRGCIPSEAEAERLARGSAGDTPPRSRPGTYSPRIPQRVGSR